MAFMMAATLVPAVPADAATENSVNKQLTLERNADVKEENGQYLRVEPKNADVDDLKAGQVFELHLNYGEWNFGSVDIKNGSATTLATMTKKTDTVAEVKIADNVTIGKGLASTAKAAATGGVTETKVDKIKVSSGAKFTWTDVAAKLSAGDSVDLKITVNGTETTINVPVDETKKIVIGGVVDALNANANFREKFFAAVNGTTATQVDLTNKDNTPVNTFTVEQTFKTTDPAFSSTGVGASAAAPTATEYTRPEISVPYTEISTATLPTAGYTLTVKLEGTEKTITVKSDADADGNGKIDATEFANKITGLPTDWAATPSGNNIKFTYGGAVKTETKPEDYLIKGAFGAADAVAKAQAEELRIPMLYKASELKEEPMKVTIVPRDTTMTEGTYTLSTVNADELKISTDKKYKISRSGSSNEVKFAISEVNNKAMNGQEVQFKLPAGFAWDVDKKDNPDVEKIEVLSEKDGKTYNRILSVTLKKGSETNLDKAYINAKIIPDRDARLGDVDITVLRGDIAPSSLVIAEYVKDGVTVKVDKVLDVIAGKDVERKYEAKVIVDENVANALLDGRYVEFSFVDDAAFLQDGGMLKVKQVDGSAKDALEIDPNSNDDLSGKADAATIKGDGKDVGSFWDMKVAQDADKTKKAKYEITVPFVVNSDFTGDLMLNVKGAGVTGDAKNGGVDVKVANVKAPVTIEAAKPLPQVKIGLQNQVGSDITIKETEAGALQDYVPNVSKDYATYALVPEKLGYVTFDSAKVEVTDGNLSVDKDASGRADAKSGSTVYKDGQIKVVVDRVSTKPSTIKVSDVKATLDRTVPYGKLQMKGQFGVVAARHSSKKDVETNTTVKFDYFTTVTPVDETKRITTVFTIGEKNYTEVNGKIKEQKTAEVAPFIQNDRTMLPVRYVANALDAAVSYDPNTRVATFTKNQIVATINIDKDIMYVNGSPVKLDGKPANVEGRIFLPVANIAQAFGLEHGKTIIWNAEAKTVTILPQNATEAEIKEAKEGKTLENAVTKEETKTEAPAETKTETKTETPAK